MGGGQGVKQYFFEGVFVADSSDDVLKLIPAIIPNLLKNVALFIL